VPPECAGTLIGRGGDTVNAISRETGARIDVSKDDKDTSRIVTISGSAEAIERAAKAVEDVIGRARERRAETEVAAASEEKRVFEVPQDYVGMLIGKGGDKIKSMTRESGAKIEVARDDGKETRTVTVSGTLEAIRKAALAIEEVVRRAADLFTTEESESEDEKLPDPPPGFLDSGHEGYFHHPGRNAFFEQRTGRICWLNSATGEFLDLHQGQDVGLGVQASATTRLGGGSGAGSSGTGTVASSPGGTRRPSPKHVVIPDLHRAGQALRVTLDHLDRPCAMLGVFCDGGAEGVPVDIAARGLHEKLIKRLAAFRCSWPDDALFGALTGALFDMAAGHGGTQPVAAVALVVGRRVAAVSAPGTSLCIVSGASADSAVPSASVVAGGATTCFEELDTDGDPEVSTVCVALAAGDTQLDEGEVMLATAPHLYPCRPRAASVALLRAARKRGAEGQLAAACARLGLPREATAAARQQGKAEDALRKVRVSQILVRCWQGKGPQPVDPVRRRPVARTPEEAEAAVLDALEGLAGGGRAGFRGACKSISECQSALQGGGLEGDLGWLDLAKDAALRRAKGEPGNPKSVVKAAVPVPVLKAAFELDVGELSDLVHSEFGVHLLLRTA